MIGGIEATIMRIQLIAPHKKHQGVKNVHDAQLLVIHRCDPLVERGAKKRRLGPSRFRRLHQVGRFDAFWVDRHRSVSRNAATALTSGSLNCIAGILHPGFRASGFRIHSRRFAGVLGATPEPIVSLLMKCVRSGP